MKGKGLLLSKVPRDTAMRPLSRRGKRKRMDSQTGALPTKVHLVKAMVFPVVMYGFESWTIKKAECQRICAYELWCLKRLLRVSPLDGKEIQPVHPKGNQS